MLVLADGTKIDPTTRKPATPPPAQKPVQQAKPATSTVANERRHGTKVRLAELPVDARTANVYGVVIFYVLIGVPDIDILEATGMTVQQLQQVKASDSFDELRSKVVANVRSSQATEVRGKIAAAAEVAADTLVSLMDSADEKVRLAAVKDVLDRDGHRPVDVVEHRVSMENEMRVRIIRDDKAEAPVIDLEVEEV